MSFDKCLALIFSLMILGQAYLVRRYVGTWLFPACIFGLFWFGYTFFPLAVLFWVPVQPYATAFIFLCTLAFSMGAVPFDWKTAFKRNERKCETASLVYGNPFLKAVFCVSVFASLLFLVLNLFDQGFTLHDLLFNLFASAASYANLVYSQNLDINLFARLSIVCTYLGAILGGFLFPCMQTKNGRRLIVVLSFLPPILMAVTQSAKWHLFLCIVFFYSGLLVYRASAGKLRLSEKGSIKSLSIYMAILIPIVAVSFLGRGLYSVEDGSELVHKLITYYLSYSCGHIYAFSDWFAFIIGKHSELIYPNHSGAHGFYTFAVLFKLMGSHKELPLGVYDQYYSYGDLLTSNIYTIFRGLITDFGFIGSVLFMLTTGFLFHWTFHAMLRGSRPVFTVVVFVFMMSYFYSSFVISILGANTIYYVTFFLLWIVLHINNRIAQKAVRQLALAEVTVISMPRLQS